MNFLTKLEITGILCKFSLVLERKTAQVKSESSKLVLRKVFGNFTLSDTEDNTSGSLHREAITDFRDLSGLTIWVG